MTATVEQTIEVQIPIATAYNQWELDRVARSRGLEPRAWRGEMPREG